MQCRLRGERQVRRLITLISAGRNRTVMIRRELPRTRDAGWVQRPYRIERRRILLSVSSRPVACTASFTRLTEPPLLNRARAACPENVPKFLAGHLVGLSVLGQMNDLNGTVGAQPGSDFRRGVPSGGIAVEHEDHVAEALAEHAFLRRVECRTHQCNHRTNTGLVQL